jgi:hypothetical protein
LGLIESVEVELQSEVCAGHPLYSESCRVVGWNTEDPNEFLFVTANAEMPLAFVHLTWKSESDPTWPFTVGYPGWDAFRLAWNAEEA